MTMTDASAAKSGTTLAPKTSAGQWERAQTALNNLLGDDLYSSWFGRVELEEASPKVLRISVPTRFLKSWITSRYSKHMLAAWNGSGACTARLEVVVRGPELRKAPKAAPPHSADEVSNARFPTPREEMVPSPVLCKEMTLGSTINSRFTFDTFCQDESNRIVVAAARAVAEFPNSAYVPPNPLYVYGDAGRGKTHLLQAIAKQAGAHALYVTASDLTDKLIQCLRGYTPATLRRDFDFRILLVDDLQSVRGEQALTTLASLTEVMLVRGRLVVFSADASPDNLDMVDDRTRSRMRGGLVFELAPPKLELRRKIVEQCYATAKFLYPSLDISQPVLEYVARNVVQDGRDIVAAINRLVAQQQYTKEALTVEAAAVSLHDLAHKRSERRVYIEDIQRIVARHYNIAKNDMLSARRTRNIVRPRQIAMYLSRVLTLRSMPEIGRQFGGRDHTTILHGVRTIENLIGRDPDFAKEVEGLKAAILG